MQNFPPNGRRIRNLLELTHRTFSRTDHVLGHKTSLNEFKMEIIPRIFSNHNGIKLEKQ